MSRTLDCLDKVDLKKWNLFTYYSIVSWIFLREQFQISFFSRLSSHRANRLYGSVLHVIRQVGWWYHRLILIEYWYEYNNYLLIRKSDTVSSARSTLGNLEAKTNKDKNKINKKDKWFFLLLFWLKLFFENRVRGFVLVKISNFGFNQLWLFHVVLVIR